MKRIILVLVVLSLACVSILPATLPTLAPTPSVPPTTAPSSTPTQTATSTATFTPSPTDTPTLTQTPTETPTPTAISFTYVFPVQPPEGTGFSEGTASHGYPATDIFAPEGAQFVAVTNGVVDFVAYTDTWDPATNDLSMAGGLCVAIIGDDGVRYYGSHLSAIAPDISPGVRVLAGQLLGYVGHTGNARTKSSHLHFGVSHPTYPEDWQLRRGEVDPFPYLTAWRNGQNVTPVLPPLLLP